jgi:large subunit ribosomal protein L23
MADEKKVAPAQAEAKKEPEIKEFVTRPLIEKDFQIIKYEIVTEATQKMRTEDNALVFAVDKHATKPEIKAAIQALFHAKVASVNTIQVRGKNRRVGKFAGKLPDYKKAIVRFDSSFDLGKIEAALASEEMKPNAEPEEKPEEAEAKAKKAPSKKAAPKAEKKAAEKKEPAAEEAK